MNKKTMATAAVGVTTLAAIILALGLLGYLLWKLPLLEVVYLMLWVLVIPITLGVALGVMQGATFGTLSWILSAGPEQVRKAVNEELKK